MTLSWTLAGTPEPAGTGAVLSLLQRPSSDLQRRESDDPDTDYRTTRRPTNTHSSTVQVLVVVVLSFLTNFIILHGAIDYDLSLIHI